MEGCSIYSNEEVIDMSKYPKVKDPKLVGTYPARACAGGGYVWDAVLEYRVWCHPPDGDDDYYYVFETYEDALAFSNETADATEPLALILQEEYIDEPEPEQYVHVKKQRITEWPVEFLSRPKRTERAIPDFLSPDAPSNRLDILRGIAK
jgi:putative acetyltransferase